MKDYKNIEKTIKEAISTYQTITKKSPIDNHFIIEHIVNCGAEVISSIISNDVDFFSFSCKKLVQFMAVWQEINNQSLMDNILSYENYYNKNCKTKLEVCGLFASDLDFTCFIRDIEEPDDYEVDIDSLLISINTACHYFNTTLDELLKEDKER